ncbi:MAG: M20/M25/M40 family metallo-hydrolase [Acidobacteria bacterium]|nr:M20/M25/M40 family metallo-hydrolase [Acidobacteriota bacterium]
MLGPTFLSTCAEPPREALTAGLSEESGWLRAYLQFDTSNPHGNVEPAAAYLARILDRAGIDYEMLDQGDGRPSLLARLPPARPAPDSETLLLLHHLDVVEADDLWRVPPFAGEVHDGVLWGRGAIDSKSLGIAHLAALVALQRSGVERRRGVAFFASAEEEMGGRLGVERWLKQRPDLFSDVTTVVTEGGTNRGYDGRLHWWGIEIAQKRPLWLEARASTPQALVAGLRRLVDLPPAWRVSPQAELTFARLAPHYNEHWRSIFLDLPRVITATGPSVGLLPGMEIFFLDSIQVNELEVLSDGGARAHRRAATARQPRLRVARANPRLARARRRGRGLALGPRGRGQPMGQHLDRDPRAPVDPHGANRAADGGRDYGLPLLPATRNRRLRLLPLHHRLGIHAHRARP